MEYVRINILWRGGWNLVSKFSDANPHLNKVEFTKRFQNKYRCTLHKNINLDTYYMEFTPEQWTWFCLHHNDDDFEFL